MEGFDLKWFMAWFRGIDTDGGWMGFFSFIWNRACGVILSLIRYVGMMIMIRT